MNPQRKLVAPRADAMDDSVLSQEFHQIVHGGENGPVEEFGVILVVIAEPFDGVPFGSQFFRKNIPERRDAAKPPFDERLVEHGPYDSGIKQAISNARDLGQVIKMTIAGI